MKTSLNENKINIISNTINSKKLEDENVIEKEIPKPIFSCIENDNQNKYCEICQKTFSTGGNLRNHIMTIHQNLRPFKCPFPGCEKKYSIQTRLQVHYRTHIGKKPYICRFCQKAFNEKGNLKTHERFHSEIRPFKCNECNKTYKTNGHLKDHIEIQHMKIRKFPCHFCDKKFGRISTLKAHIRTHTGEKNYKCKIENCNKFFAEKGNMEIHYKRHLKRILNQKNHLFNNSNCNCNYNDKKIFDDNCDTCFKNNIQLNNNFCNFDFLSFNYHS